MADRRGKTSGPPMTLANMRANGVRAVASTCEACGHAADVDVDALAETITVPEAGRRLRCSQCGGKRINTRPAWHVGRDTWGRSL
jgi:ABC-type hemin transport system substrate-binding protein